MIQKTKILSQKIVFHRNHPKIRILIFFVIKMALSVSAMSKNMLFLQCLLKIREAIYRDFFLLYFYQVEEML